MFSLKTIVQLYYSLGCKYGKLFFQFKLFTRSLKDVSLRFRLENKQNKKLNFQNVRFPEKTKRASKYLLERTIYFLSETHFKF